MIKNKPSLSNVVNIMRNIICTLLRKSLQRDTRMKLGYLNPKDESEEIDIFCPTQAGGFLWGP